MLRIRDCLFVHNRVWGTSPSGNIQADGAAVCVWNANLDISGTSFELNEHNGTFSRGGALSLVGGVGGVSLSTIPTPTDTASIRDSTFTLNSVDTATDGTTAINLLNFPEESTRGPLRLNINRTVVDGNGNPQSGPAVRSSANQSDFPISLTIRNSILTLNRGALVSTLFNRDNSEAILIHSTIADNFHYLSDGECRARCHLRLEDQLGPLGLGAKSGRRVSATSLLFSGGAHFHRGPVRFRGL